MTHARLGRTQARLRDAGEAQHAAYPCRVSVSQHTHEAVADPRPVGFDATRQLPWGCSTKIALRNDQNCSKMAHVLRPILDISFDDIGSMPVLHEEFSALQNRGL